MHHIGPMISLSKIHLEAAIIRYKVGKMIFLSTVMARIPVLDLCSLTFKRRPKSYTKHLLSAIRSLVSVSSLKYTKITIQVM